MDFDNVRGILKKCAEIIPRGSHVGRGIFSKIAWAWHRGIPRPTRGVISSTTTTLSKMSKMPFENGIVHILQPSNGMVTAAAV